MCVRVSCVCVYDALRSPAQVREACKSNGGFYLGSIGGPAAVLAQDNITKVCVCECVCQGCVWA